MSVAAVITHRDGLLTAKLWPETERFVTGIHDVAQAQQQADQAKQQATEAADTAASTIATGALAAAIALLLGAVGGWFGGRAGAVDPVVTASPTTTSARRGF